MGDTKSGLIDRGFPAAAKAKLGKRLQALFVAYNVLAVNKELPAVLTKLDGSGATDTNYAALLTPTSVLNTRTQFNALLTKLSADVLVADATFVSLKAQTDDELDEKYTALLKKLDTNAGVAVNTFTSGNSAATLETLDD